MEKSMQWVEEMELKLIQKLRCLILFLGSGYVARLCCTLYVLSLPVASNDYFVSFDMFAVNFEHFELILLV